MAHSVEFRKKVIEYLAEGHVPYDARKKFGISDTTVARWVKMYKDNQDLRDKPLIRKHKKLDPKKLRKYVLQNPDASWKTIGKAFGCDASSVGKAFKRLGITHKGKTYSQKNK